MAGQEVEKKTGSEEKEPGVDGGESKRGVLVPPAINKSSPFPAHMCCGKFRNNSVPTLLRYWQRSRTSFRAEGHPTREPLAAAQWQV